MRKFLRDKGKLARKAASKELKPVVLIVCEGRETEPNYFNDLKRALDLTSVEVEVVGSDVCGTAPRSIVDYAKTRMNELLKDKREVDRKNVWCVFDRDEHPSFAEAMDMAKGNGFGVAFSNPCFELWYLLHFQDQKAPIGRDAVTRALKTPGNFPEYSKNMKGLFRRLLSRLPDAEARAQSLRTKHKDDNSPETHNPSTGVDRLVGRLREISNS